MLVADASIAIQKVVSLTLEEQGCTVVSVSDGDAAIAELGARTIGVALVATNLAKRSGYQVCEWVKNQAGMRGTRVILLKAIGEAVDNRLGAPAWDAVLAKPFMPQELVAVISKLENATTSAPPRGPTTA